MSETTTQPQPRSWRLWLLVFLGYLGISILITWPLVTDLSGQFIGHDTSDAYEMGHHIWWFKYALQTGEPLFYQTLLAYPDGIQGISLWADPLQFFPAWAFAFVMPIAAAYNITILLTMALNGWAMWWLARYLLRRTDETPSNNPQSEIPALLSGLVFLAFPTFQGHLFGGHAGLLVMWPVPLLVWALFQLVEPAAVHSRGVMLRRFFLAVLLFVMSPFGHTLQTIYVLMPLMGMFLLWRLFRRDWRGAAYVTGVGLVGGIILLIFLIPVIQDTFSTEAYAGEGFAEYSADLLGIVTPSFMHPFFGQFEYTRRVLGVNLIEGSTYVGIAAALLAFIAALRRRESRWWLLLALLSWLLSLGPLVKLFDQPVTLQIADTETYLALPWAWVYNLPGFSLARTPGRFTFTLALAVAALAGYGMAVLWGWLVGRGRALQIAVAAALSLFVLWEYQSFWPYPTLPADVPQAVKALAERDDVRAVMDVPWGNLLAAKDGLYLQVWHQKPLIAGQVTRRTPVSPAKLNFLETTLNPALLGEVGVDIIILHKTRADMALQTRLRDVLGQPTYEDERLALYEIPASTEAAASTYLLPDGTRFDDAAETYFYAAAPGWYDFNGTLAASNRDVSLYLDGLIIHQWQVSGETSFAVPFYVNQSGFYTLRLALTPPCPAQFDPSLTCKSLRFEPSGDAPLIPRENVLDSAVEMGDGLSLGAAYIPDELDVTESLPVDLFWQFASLRAESDVRFVHVLDSDGQQVAGFDSAPGARNAGDALAERVLVDTSALSTGTYEVYTGWYSYPDLQRFPVLANTPRAQDSLIYLGEIIIR